MIRIRAVARAAVLFLPLLLSARPDTQPAVPRIDWADLPSIVEKSPDVKTGYLVVPERRFPAPTGKTIRLPFIILKSRSAAPRPDPVLFTTGGPGGSTLFQQRLWRRHPLLDDRDIILFEQRGTRFAEPALMCPEIERTFRSGWGTRLNGDPDPQAVTAAMTAAARSLREEGVDLAGYTTRESAADIADLKQLLGIASWNLYGSSYSTDLMLIILRDHPEGVRAAILDSLLPPEAHWDEDGPANILEALERLFTICREDESLRARFPELRERFFRLLAEANRRPLEITIKNPLDGSPLALRLDGPGVMNCIYAGLEDAAAIPDLPLIIDAACRGDAGRLEPLARNYLGSSQGFAWGMRLAIWANEVLPFEKPEKILKPAGLPPELARFIQAAVPVEALQSWPQGHPDPREDEPVKSGVPILIAAGEFDPDTPPKWARRDAALLRNAHLIEFAGYTHVPLRSHPEAARIMREFLSDPSNAPALGNTAVRRPFQLSWEEKTPADMLAGLFAKRDVTIAVVDSGLGGLSIMAGLASRLEDARIFRRANLVFFNALFSNDNGYNSLPSRGAKIAVFDSALRSLAERAHPDVILVGCNTLSVLLPDTPFARSGTVPVLGIVEPGVEMIASRLGARTGAASALSAPPVLIFGTETTIAEGEHRRRLVEKGIPDTRIVTQACPELASYIEKAPLSDETGLLIESYVDEALAKTAGPKADAVVGLCCTHFGYSLDLWRKAFADRGVRADMVNPNAGLAEALVPARLRGRAPSTEIRARAVSMVEIGPEKIAGLGNFIRRISPKTADALAGYELRPDLFEWRSLIGK